MLSMFQLFIQERLARLLREGFDSRYLIA